MPSQRHLTILLLGLLIAIAGCSRPINKLMPVPEIYTSGDLEPFGADDAKYTVFYATDRNKIETDVPSKQFGNKRGAGLHIGHATVRIGAENQSWQQVAEQSRAGRALALDIVEAEDYGMLHRTYWAPTEARDEQPEPEDLAPGNRLYAAINEELERTNSKRIVLYTTGFNTNYAWPIQMAGQWRHFTGRDAVWISLCWASSDSMFKYVQDAGTAGLTVRRARELILALAKNTNAEKIDLVAYSFGAVIVSGILTELRLMHAKSTPEEIAALKIGRVYYVAPDEDLDMFLNMFLDRVQDLFDSIQVYTSDSDSALSLSRNWYFSHARLGRSLSELKPETREALAKLHESGFIDATHAQAKAGRAKSGHGYWYGNPWVSGDLALALRFRLLPEERGLVRSEDGANWEFPDDYPQRVAKLAKELAAKKN
ncbi:MAG: alpha/beta hydrolase [Planctomycetota bacterium]|jgi:esterase/lipase superfamily enzyme